MILFVNGISTGISCTNVGFCINDHESAFELLTQLVVDNWVLLEATVVDGLDRLSVPVEAFDGQPIQVHIRILQQQWQLILSDQPILPDRFTNQQLKKWFIHLDVYYDDMLTHLGKMISMLQMGKALLATHSDEYIRLNLGGLYTSMIAINRQILKQTRVSRQKNRIRLNQSEF